MQINGKDWLTNRKKADTCLWDGLDDRLNKDFRAVIINMLKELRETIFKEVKEGMIMMSHYQQELVDGQRLCHLKKEWRNMRRTFGKYGTLSTKTYAWWEHQTEKTEKGGYSTIVASNQFSAPSSPFSPSGTPIMFILVGLIVFQKFLRLLSLFFFLCSSDLSFQMTCFQVHRLFLLHIQICFWSL